MPTKKRNNRKTKTRRLRRMRGGFHPLNDMYGSNAAPYAGEQTARPQVWVGGRKKKRKHTKKRR